VFDSDKLTPQPDDPSPTMCWCERQIRKSGTKWIHTDNNRQRHGLNPSRAYPAWKDGLFTDL
jgi:hypothetical protein